MSYSGGVTMAVEWRVKATEFANCNCAYGCPCQFNALPTHGDCRAAIGYQIEEGHFGAVRLDGLRMAMLVSWPGPVHQGNGTMQVIIDERADAAQRDALLKIMTGQETDDMATMWWVYSAMSPNKLEPLFRPIEVDIDVEARRGPFPGARHRRDGRRADPQRGDRRRAPRPHRSAARLRIPGRRDRQRHDPGDRGDRAPGLENTYGQFAHIHLSNKGVVD